VRRLFLAGCFLAIVYGFPLWQGALEISRAGRPRFLDLFAHTPTPEHLRDFERGLEDSAIYSKKLRPLVQYVWWKLLDNPGEKVVVGRDGWLFYKPDVRYLVEPGGRGSREETPLSAILTFRNQLARRGIRLMVLPAPGKPSVYPDKLSRRPLSAERSAECPARQLIRGLREAGVETIDLFETFRQLRESERPDLPGPYYLLRDTHWSGTAARIAAESVARRIRNLAWIESGAVQYSVRTVWVNRQTDIVRMMRLPEIGRQLSYEEVRCDQVVRTGSGNLYRDDPNSPVLVLGDSFLRIYETDEPRAAGFIAHLARALGLPLASLINDGGASTLVRQELSRRADLLRGKKLVIWEFVERDILFGTQGWKYVPLPG